MVCCLIVCAESGRLFAYFREVSPARIKREQEGVVRVEAKVKPHRWNLQIYIVRIDYYYYYPKISISNMVLGRIKEGLLLNKITVRTGKYEHDAVNFAYEIGQE